MNWLSVKDDGSIYYPGIISCTNTSETWDTGLATRTINEVKNPTDTLLVLPFGDENNTINYTGVYSVRRFVTYYAYINNTHRPAWVNEQTPHRISQFNVSFADGHTKSLTWQKLTESPTVGNDDNSFFDVNKGDGY